MLAFYGLSGPDITVGAGIEGGGGYWVTSALSRV